MLFITDNKGRLFTSCYYLHMVCIKHEWYCEDVTTILYYLTIPKLLMDDSIYHSCIASVEFNHFWCSVRLLPLKESFL